MFEQTFKNIDDILHNDAGCSSELDYVEQTSWILFLKYLDDLERDRKTSASNKLYSQMAEIKTKPTTASVHDFIIGVQDAQKRKDSFLLVEMMKEATGEEPKMWGASLIGFGNVRIKSPATGREVDWLRIGFSPRKANLSLYLCGDIKQHVAKLEKLGKHKTGVGCLYINKLEDVDIKVLKELIDSSLDRDFFGNPRL